VDKTNLIIAKALPVDKEAVKRYSLKGEKGGIMV